MPVFPVEAESKWFLSILSFLNLLEVSLIHFSSCKLTALLIFCSLWKFNFIHLHLTLHSLQDIELPWLKFSFLFSEYFADQHNHKKGTSSDCLFQKFNNWSQNCRNFESFEQLEWSGDRPCLGHHRRCFLPSCWAPRSLENWECTCRSRRRLGHHRKCQKLRRRFLRSNFRRWKKLVLFEGFYEIDLHIGQISCHQRAKLRFSKMNHYLKFCRCFLTPKWCSIISRRSASTSSNSKPSNSSATSRSWFQPLV